MISSIAVPSPRQVLLQVRFAEVSRTLVREIGSNLQTRDQTGGFLFGAGTRASASMFGVRRFGWPAQPR